MNCIILAAGYATRLYPLTENFPKPLLKIRDKSILDILIDDIEYTGDVDDIIIVSNHKFVHYFEDWLKTKINLNCNIRILDDGSISNETRLGAVCDIELALKFFDNPDDTLVVAGDNVLDFSLKYFTNYFKIRNATCIMRYFEPDTNKITKSACAVIDGDDLVINMIEKPVIPASNWCIPPFYIYSVANTKLIREALDNDCNKDAPGSFINWLFNRSNIYAMEMPGKRYDIGNLESYNDVNVSYKGIKYEK